MSRVKSESSTSIPSPEHVQIKPDPAGARAVVPSAEDMFLSPRVMDASAFSKYSDTLKSIIAHATNQGRTLEDFSADAEEMIRRTNESEKTLDKRLQAGMRLLKLLDERAEQTSAMLEQSSAAVPDTDELEQRVQKAVSDIVLQSVKAIESAAHDAETRARDAQAASDASAARLEGLLASLETRSAELESRVHGAEKHATDSGASLERRVIECEQRIAIALDSAVESAESRAAKIEQQLTLGTTSMSADLDALRSSLGPIRETAKRACEALGMDPEAPDLHDSPIARIESIVERGEKNVAGADRLFRQLESLRMQAETVKSDFGAWLLQAASDLDALESRRDLLDGPISDVAKSLEGYTPEIESKIQDAQRTLDELSTHAEMLSSCVVDASTKAQGAKHELVNQSAQMQALLDGSINKLTERVELAGQWLGTLITQARESGTAVGGDPQNASFDPSLRIARPDDAGARETRTNETRAPETQREDAAVRLEHGATQSSSVPSRLPIDSLSFDGSADVFEHLDSDTVADTDDEMYPGAD